MRRVVRLALLAAVIGAAACSDVGPSAPRVTAPAASHDLVCGSGYVIAYDENGNAYCAPAGVFGGAARPKFPK